MDSSAQESASPADSSREPIPATAVYPPPPTIVVQYGAGRFQRALSWVGWFGFAVCLAIVFSQSMALSRYFDTTDGVREKFHSGEKYAKDKIAVISVSGAIVDGSGHVKKQIERVREDDNVKAVVVRIVSPGGTITGSDYILHHLRKLRDEKKIPLVVSMGSIAASGGYYVAMAVGDQERSIYAEPTTTTGSIGVIIPHYDLSGLLQRYEIADDSLTSHPNKQMLSMTRPMSDEHRQILGRYLTAAFDRFKEVVKQGRPAFRADSAALDRLATGEIFTADQAKQHGLIDEIGFIEEAIERAGELAQLDKEKTRVVEYQRPPSLFDLPWAAQGRTLPGGLDLAAWFDLNTPQAYYLATTLPPMLSSGSR